MTLHACQSVPGTSERALAQGLQVAEAALAAGRADLARQLYQSLVKRYPEAPVPRLRLARIAFEQGDFRLARRQFVKAAELELPDYGRAEAWFGAGRAALASDEPAEAGPYFLRARALVTDPKEAAWIANGLGVAAAIDDDLEGAGARYREAIELDPSNPRILANYVRLLTEAGRASDAARVFTAQPSSFWSDDDERRLRILLQTPPPRPRVAGDGP